MPFEPGNPQKFRDILEKLRTSYGLSDKRAIKLMNEEHKRTPPRTPFTLTDNTLGRFRRGERIMGIAGLGQLWRVLENDPFYGQAFVSLKPTLQPERLQRFAGTYQTIRPYVTDDSLYVLEPLSIAMNESGEIENWMFSRNYPELKYIYHGTAVSAYVNYFSLLTRRHDKDPAENSFRCIALYIGEGADPRCLSGLMLRGVSGRSGETLQPAGVPFIALASGEEIDLEEPVFVQARKGNLYKLRGGSHVVVGDVSTETEPAMFAFCERIFHALAGNDKSPPVREQALRTTPPDRLRRIDAARFESWKPLVDQVAWRTSDS
jgi:hypothetical protein